LTQKNSCLIVNKTQRDDAPKDQGAYVIGAYLSIIIVHLVSTKGKGIVYLLSGKMVQTSSFVILEKEYEGK